MAKLKIPLLSLKATGGLSKLFSLAKRQGRHIIERKPIPTDAKSPAQLFSRLMFSKCVDLWHLLSDAEKQEWESAARPKHMTGYAWYISQCLRPNPGIYLPLQGGTMSGDIDMAKYRLLKLPLPTHDQEAASKKYHDDNLPPGGYTEGARAYSGVNQAIPNATFTVLALELELYDTDTIHDLVINNSRLTCKTAGIYLIAGSANIISNAIGRRSLLLRLNGIATYAYVEWDTNQNGGTFMHLSTILRLAITNFVELSVYQSSGGVLNSLFADYYGIQLMMQRIG